LAYKVALISLGCSKNLVDSEIMLGLLTLNGFVLENNLTDADVIIINTCGFILPAKKEAIDTILSAAEYKRIGKCRVLVVTGCLVQKYRKDLVDEIPEIDGFLGTSEFENIVSLVNEKLDGSSRNIKAGDLYQNRYLATQAHTAYIKIAEGCSNRCTYCLIPELRGKYQSRPLESVVEEVKKLTALGVKEITLIAQDTTFYGVDIYGEPKLPQLLKLLAEESVPWIRLLYCYPLHISQELLDVMAAYPNICHYLDIPIQHSDNTVLKRMGRRETKSFLLNLFSNIRKTIPDIALRTTCMVGFPGETEKIFQGLLDFIEEVRFDWMGAFTYSREEDTPAALMKNQVPEKDKEDRFHRLMSLQAKISSEQKKKWIGKTISVLIEGLSPDHPEYFIGRSEYHAPEVDGVVLIRKQAELKPGDFYPVRITDADVYDLIGEIKTNEPGQQTNFS